MGGVLGPSTAAVQGGMLSDGRNGINMPLMEQNSVFAVFPAAEWALVAGDCGGAPLQSSPAPRTSGHAAAAAAGSPRAGGGNIFSDLQQYLHG